MSLTMFLESGNRGSLGRIQPDRLRCGYWSRANVRFPPKTDIWLTSDPRKVTRGLSRLSASQLHGGTFAHKLRPCWGKANERRFRLV